MNKKSAHKSSWKAAHQHAKLQKRTKLAILMLGLVVAIMAVGNLVRFTQNLFQPISQTVKKQYSWDGETRINLVVKSKTVSVLSFDPNKKEVAIMNLPSETEVQVPGGYGNWPVRSIYDLGQSEKPPKGALLLSQSMGLYLGLPIDGYIQTDKTGGQIVSDFRSPMGIKDLLSNIQTDLSPIELIRLGFGLSKVRFDKINTYQSDPQALDNQIKYFADSQIQNEQATVAVFNATDRPGLAAQVAREITNMGGNVTIQTSTETKMSKTFIVGQDGYTKKRLSQIFCSKSICDKMPANSLDFRAQINVVLGEDFASK